MPIPIIKKIKTLEEKQEVIDAAVADNHNFYIPTHAVIKNNEIVGAWSLGAIPLVTAWHKTDGVNAKDSLIINKSICAIMDDRGHQPYIIACDETSPYINYMEKFGYKNPWKTNLFLSQ